MTRWDVVWGCGVLAVLAVLVTQVVRSVREVLAVERRRRAKVVGGVEQKRTTRRCSPSDVDRGAGGFLPAVGPSPQTPAERVVAELEGRR